MRSSLFSQLEKQIQNMPSGTVMTVSDFYALAKPKTVSKMLTRLMEKGCIEKVLRSIFWKPDGVSTAPDPDAVAKALARENNWELAPSGETALHLMGIGERQPKVWTYVTSGTYRSYLYRGVRINFMHTSGELGGMMSEKTRMLVQCIRAYGPERLTEDAMRRLIKSFGELNYAKILEECKHVSGWVFKALLSMSAMGMIQKTIK